MSNSVQTIASGRYAFLDLGSGTGGSLAHCSRRFGATPGLGVELDASDAAEARRRGFEVVAADVTALTVPDRTVRFLSAMDFLEHLPDAETALGVLERTARAARDFVFIRHPSFEDTDYLAGLGVKLCWTDWTEHPNMMLLADYLDLFERLGWNHYAIVPRHLIVDASDDQVVPLSAPRDTETYDPRSHEPRPLVRFDRPVFAQFDIFIRLNPDLDEAEWKRIVATDLVEDSPVWPATIAPSIATRPQMALGVYDALTALWTMYGEDGTERVFSYGARNRGWLAFTGDWNGDGEDGIGVYDPRSGDFFLRNELSDGDADVTVGFGAPNGIPVAGDWTGSGVDTLGVYIPDTGQWFLKHENASGTADESFSFGAEGRGLVPVAGDWNGDGRDEVGLYDPATAAWHIRGGESFTFGPTNGQPVAGDWNGDGKDSIGVYVPDWGLWILRDENSNGPASARFSWRAPAGMALTARVPM